MPISQKIIKSIRNILLSVVGCVIIACICFMTLLGGSATGGDQKKSTIKYTRVGSVRDISYSNIIRKEVKISIAKGYNKRQIQNMLEVVAKQIGKELNVDALTLKCYADGDDFTGPYTVGDAIYAPNGDWAAAGSNNPKSTTINFATLYFENNDDAEIKIGDTVELVSRDGDGVRISSEIDNWEDNKIISKLDAGVEARVIDVHSEVVTPDYTFKRVKVKNNDVIGWVHHSEVKVKK